MGSPSLRRAVELAAGSHGLLTRDQLREAGIDPQVAERQVRRRSWQQPARGIYVPHPRPLSGLELGRVASTLAQTRVVLSGLVVLRELGLRWIPESPGVLALVAPDVHTRSSGRVTLRRTATLEQLVTWRRAGLELALPARAVVDGARELRCLRDVRGVVLGAVADGRVGVEELTQVLATTQRNGSGLTRRAIRDAERGCASPPEAELVDELVGCGRPFYVNPELVLNGVRLGFPDVWMVGLGLGGEVESQERHGDDEQTESTYDRHERMTAPGIELVHLSVRRIRRDPREAAAHLLRQAQGRSRLPAPEPPGLVVLPRGPLLQ